MMVVLSAFGQGKRVFERRDDLKDFLAKTIKVVLEGNQSLDDLMMTNVMKNNWYISPYEFCSKSDFEKMKSDTNYFFLLKVDGQFSKEKEPAMEFLTIVKGDEDADKGIDHMPEVISLPYRSLNDKSGDSYGYLAPFVNILQSHIIKVQRNKHSAYVGLSAYSDGMDSAGDMDILFEKDDFTFDVTHEMLIEDFKGKARFVSKDEIHDNLAKRTPNTLVSIVIAPNVSQRGAYSFNMLVSTETWELYLYRKHKITNKLGPGFVKEDYKRMVVPYAF